MCIITLITHRKHTSVLLTPAEQSLQPRCLSEHFLHARCFLWLRGFYWQGWRKHTNRVSPGALPWADLTPLSAGNSFLALRCGLKTMEKKPSKHLILVRISTWILKTALPDFMCWRVIYDWDTLQITQKDATLWRNSKTLRFKRGARPESAATNIPNFHSQFLPPISKLLRLSFTCSFNINCFWFRGDHPVFSDATGTRTHLGFLVLCTTLAGVPTLSHKPMWNGVTGGKTASCCLDSLPTSFPWPSLLPPPHGSCSLSWSLPRGNLQVWSKEARLGYRNNLLLN